MRRVAVPFPYGRGGSPLGESEGVRLLPREKLAKIFDFFLMRGGNVGFLALAVAFTLRPSSVTASPCHLPPRGKALVR